MPVLFLYSQNIAKKLANELSTSVKNESWFSVILWTLAKGQLGDIRDFESFKVTANAATIRDKAFFALSCITEDYTIYLGISVITQVIEHSVTKRELDPKNAFDILLKIEEYAKDNLPDKQNIKHVGYKIVSLARINSAKSNIYRNLNRKGHFRQDDIKNTWNKLERLSKEKITNRADQVFVITNLAEEMSVWNPDKAKILLNSISEKTKNIPSLLDRSDRMSYIAKTWGMWGQIEQADFFYTQSINLIHELDSWSQDQRLEHIVQAAYKFSPELADDIVERLDSRFPDQGLKPFQLSLTSLKYSDNLDLLLNKSESKQNRIQGLLIKTSANKMLNALVNQNGIVPHREKILNMLYRSSFYESDVVNDVLRWVLECEGRQQRHSSSGLFSIFIQSSKLIHELANWISPLSQRGISQNYSSILPGLSSRVKVFQSGHRKRAESWVRGWIKENAEGYIEICDPYFGPQELAFLSDVQRDIKILIITTSKKFDNKEDPEKIQQELHHAWRRVGKGKIPSMTLLIVPTKLENTFHDRAIITKNSGLDIGPSLNGLGTKIQRITELDHNEAQELEVKYINPMLNQRNWYVNHSVSPIYITIE